MEWPHLGFVFALRIRAGDPSDMRPRRGKGDESTACACLRPFLRCFSTLFFYCFSTAGWYDTSSNLHVFIMNCPSLGWVWVYFGSILVAQEGKKAHKVRRTSFSTSKNSEFLNLKCRITSTRGLFFFKCFPSVFSVFPVFLCWFPISVRHNHKGAHTDNDCAEQHTPRSNTSTPRRSTLPGGRGRGRGRGVASKRDRGNVRKGSGGGGCVGLNILVRHANVKSFQMTNSSFFIQNSRFKFKLSDSHRVSLTSDRRRLFVSTVSF